MTTDEKLAILAKAILYMSENACSQHWEPENGTYLSSGTYFEDGKMIDALREIAEGKP